MNATLKPGQRAWYVPHDDHHLDTDHEGTACFHFVHERSDTHGDKHAGKPAQLGEVGALVGRTDKGHLKTVAGHVLRHTGSKRPWPAEVAEVPPVRHLENLTEGSDLLQYPASQVHAGMTVTCLSAPEAFPSGTVIRACGPGHEVRLSAPATLSGQHLLEIAGGGLQLNIRHPRGTHVLHYRIDNGPNPVTLDPAKRPHTFHPRASESE